MGHPNVGPPVRNENLQWESFKIIPLGNEIFKAFYGCVIRSFENCDDQPIYHYRLDVQWKMFTEAPYKGESEITRLEYCRSGPLFS